VQSLVAQQTKPLDLQGFFHVVKLQLYFIDELRGMVIMGILKYPGSSHHVWDPRVFLLNPYAQAIDLPSGNLTVCY
jgi:hypothetical protein